MDTRTDFAGRCQCGAVTASIRAVPVAVRQCWCRQCQQVSAGGCTTNVIFPTDAVEVHGEISSHSYLAPSGNTLTQSYCGGCGTPVFAASSGRPQFRTFRMGFLDVDHGLRPQAAIWLSEAPEWACIDPSLERFDAQPPPPGAPKA